MADFTLPIDENYLDRLSSSSYDHRPKGRKKKKRVWQVAGQDDQPESVDVRSTCGLTVDIDSSNVDVMADCYSVDTIQSEPLPNLDSRSRTSFIPPTLSSHYVQIQDPEIKEVTSDLETMKHLFGDLASLVNNHSGCSSESGEIEEPNQQESASDDQIPVATVTSNTGFSKKELACVVTSGASLVLVVAGTGVWLLVKKIYLG